VAGARIEAHGEVNNAAEGGGHQDAEGQLRADFSPEVGSNLVHVVVYFTQEHGPFVWENQNDVLDSIHSDVHSHEEERALDVLKLLTVVLGIGFVTRFYPVVNANICARLPKEKGHEGGGHASGQQFHVGGLGQTNNVQEVAGRKQLVLVAPGRWQFLGVFFAGNREDVGMHF